MIALDTNILARLVLNDDPEQARIAAELIAENPVFIPKTVLLELAWVLGRHSVRDRAAMHESLVNLCNFPSVTVEDSEAVFAALDLFKDGLDIADAIHLATVRRVKAIQWFATFDVALVKRTVGSEPPVRHP